MTGNAIFSVSIEHKRGCPKTIVRQSLAKDDSLSVILSLSAFDELRLTIIDNQADNSFGTASFMYYTYRKNGVACY